MTGPSRRDVLGGAAALGAAGLRPPGARADAPGPRFLVPGYVPEDAFLHGRPIVDDPDAARAVPADHDGPTTMLTRIDPRADRVDRILLPFAGHGIAVRPGRREALFVSMNGAEAFALDADSLDVAARASPAAEGFVFGGHGVYDRSGDAVFVVERHDVADPFRGSAAEHEGRISVRDGASLAVLETYSCGGIGPHDIALTADGRSLVVANYGSTAWPEGAAAPAEGLPYGVEPCIAVVDVASGRVASRHVLQDRKRELRHVAAASLERIVGMATRTTTFEDAQRRLAGAEGVYQPDPSDREGLGYVPVPLVVWDATAGEAAATEVIAPDATAMNRGQSVVYDPLHDEGLATFTTSNTVAVVGGEGTLRRLIRTDRMGLRWPRGIALLPDGEHYAVAGDWENIFVFRRGTHELVRDRCRYDLLFGHSHIAVL